METTQPKTWPPAPQQKSEIPIDFEVEGVHVTRTEHSLRVENVKLWRRQLWLGGIAAIWAFAYAYWVIFFVIGLHSIYLLYRSGKAWLTILLLLLLVLTLFVSAFMGVIATSLSSANLLLLRRFQESSKATFFDRRAITAIADVRVEEKTFLRRPHYLVGVMMLPVENASVLAKLRVSLHNRLLVYGKSRGRCYFASFKDRANAERVAQVIADFANVPIEHRVADGR